MRPATLLSVVAVLLLTGCQKKDPVAAADGATPAAGPAVARPADAGTPAVVDPVIAKDQIRDPIKFAAQMDRMKRVIDPSKAPGYVKKIIEHMRRITGLMRANIDDCDKVVDEMKKYMQENKAELLALHEQGQKAHAGMSPEEKAEVTAQTLLLMSPFAEGLARIQSSFAVKCSDQAHDVAEMMQAVVGD